MITGITRTPSSDDDIQQEDAQAHDDPGQSTAHMGAVPLAPLTRMQARVRGNQVRQNFRVRRVPTTDIIRGTIKGDSTVFDTVGMSGIDTSTGPKHVEYFKTPVEKYSTYLAGGKNEAVSPTAMVPGDIKRLFSETQSAFKRYFIRTRPEPKLYITAKGSTALCVHDAARFARARTRLPGRLRTPSSSRHAPPLHHQPPVNLRRQ